MIELQHLLHSTSENSKFSVTQKFKFSDEAFLQIALLVVETTTLNNMFKRSLKKQINDILDRSTSFGNVVVKSKNKICRNPS